MKKLIETYEGSKYTFKEYLPTIALTLGLLIILAHSLYKKEGYVNIYKETELNQQLTDVYQEKGNLYLSLPNRKNKYRIKNLYNENYKPSSLGNFIRINDTLRKRKHNDTLYVVRNSETYYFLIEYLSYP